MSGSAKEYAWHGKKQQTKQTNTNTRASLTAPLANTILAIHIPQIYKGTTYRTRRFLFRPSPQPDQPMSNTKMKIPDILFHGTSTRRWQRIQKDGLLRVAPVGLRAISMSEDPRVALHFAEMAVFGDQIGRPRCKTAPIILAVNAKALLSQGYKLECFSDPVWGKGACDWEREVMCRIDVPSDFVMKTNLIGILPPHPAKGPGARE